jgi:two-component system, LytTR family, sensor histidine kinase AlgZ
VNHRRWIPTIIWTVIGCLAATYVFTGAGWQTSWQRVAEQTFFSLMFAGSCALMCVLVLPVVVPPIRQRLPLVLSYIVIIGMLVVLATAGSLIGALGIILLGAVPDTDPFLKWFPNSWKISVYFTVIFGFSGSVIGELRQRLASTTVALRTRERNEAEARRLAAEAQLASLESRVDPHFLFNTLNSIAALVRDKPADAERVIEQLSSLMRSSLDRRSPFVPLDEELEIVRGYLEIERVRFGKRLRFKIEPLLDGRSPFVPRLSLQTLVENSVKYAVSPSRDGASIAVRVSTSDGRLRVAVEDDGPGFDASHLPEGHGLQLLKSRLAMAFGERATLVATSGPGRTIVELDIPFETTMPQPVGVNVPAAPEDRTC